MSSSKKRRRLYEPFAILEAQESQENFKTIAEQNENISKTEFKTIVEQYENNTETEILVSKTQPKTVLETIHKQYWNNDKTIVEQTETEHKTIQQSKAIVGLQRKILNYLFHKAQSLGTRETGRLYSEQMAESLGCTIETVRTSLQRLEKKGQLKRKEYKSGRGGFSSFEIPVHAYNEMVLENNSGTYLKQNENNYKTIIKHQDNESTTQLKTQPKTTDIDSSSNVLNLNKEILTITIPENLKKLVSKKELEKIIAKQILEEDQLQVSLDNFSYDLENNLVKAKTSPINLFFGLTRSGQIYKSTKLIELQNQELREHLAEVERMQQETKALKEAQLRIKFQEYKLKNPDFVKSFENNSFIQSEEMSERLAFQSFIETLK